jgi:hypothetical protein
MWSFRSLETLLQDLRYSLRMIVRNPSFTAVAILTITLGNGLHARVTSSMATDSCSMFRVCRTQFLNPRLAGITAMPHEQGI